MQSIRDRMAGMSRNACGARASGQEGTDRRSPQVPGLASVPKPAAHCYYRQITFDANGFPVVR